LIVAAIAVIGGINIKRRVLMSFIALRNWPYSWIIWVSSFTINVTCSRLIWERKPLKSSSPNRVSVVRITTAGTVDV
jgi:hypothetical protein